MLRRVFAFAAVFAAFVTSARPRLRASKWPSAWIFPLTGTRGSRAKCTSPSIPSCPPIGPSWISTWRRETPPDWWSSRPTCWSCVPRIAAKSNGTAFLEIANRGSSPFWGALNLGAARGMPGTQDMGDHFMLDQGFTLVWVGWQFDVNPGREQCEAVRAGAGGRHRESADGDSGEPENHFGGASLRAGRRGLGCAHGARSRGGPADRHSERSMEAERRSDRVRGGIRARQALRLRVYGQRSGGGGARHGGGSRLRLLYQAARRSEAGHRRGDFAERTIPAVVPRGRLQRRRDRARKFSTACGRTWPAAVMAISTSASRRRAAPADSSAASIFPPICRRSIPMNCSPNR